MMFLFHFCAKRKALSLLLLPSVMLQYKPKSNDFLALNQHAKTKIHVPLCKDLKTGSQTVITGGKSSNPLVCISSNASII